MKTSKLLIIAVLALGLPGLGCHKAEQVVVTTKTAPTGPVELTLKWPLGRHGIQSMSMKQNAVMNIPGMPQPMNQEMTLDQDSSLTVVPAADAGKRSLEMEYLNAKMAMSMAGKSMLIFDSTKSQAGDTNPAAGTLGKMIGSKIQFLLDDSNQVESVTGADELAQKMTTSPQVDPSGMMKSMFTGDALKQAIDFAQLLPGKAVQPGDTWPVHREFVMGPMGTMDLDYTYTFDSWEKHGNRYCAKIEIDGTLKNKPGETPGMAGMSFAIHDGKTSGETWFDVDMGMFVDTTLNQDMKMDITMPNPMARRNPNGPKTMTIQSTMTQTIATKFELK